MPLSSLCLPLSTQLGLEEWPVNRAWVRCLRAPKGWRQVVSGIWLTYLPTYLLVLVCARQVLHRWRNMLASSFKIFETVTLYAKKSLVSGQLGRCARPWTHLEV